MLSCSAAVPAKVTPGIAKTPSRLPLKLAATPAPVMSRVPAQAFAARTVTTSPSAKVIPVAWTLTSPVVRSAATARVAAPKLNESVVRLASATASAKPGAIPSTVEAPLLKTAVTVPTIDRPPVATPRVATVRLPWLPWAVAVSWPAIPVACTSGPAPSARLPLLRSRVKPPDVQVATTSARRSTAPATWSVSPVPDSRSGTSAAMLRAVVVPAMVNDSATAEWPVLSCRPSVPERLSPGTARVTVPPTWPAMVPPARTKSAEPWLSRARPPARVTSTPVRASRTSAVPAVPVRCSSTRLPLNCCPATVSTTPLPSTRR